MNSPFRVLVSILLLLSAFIPGVALAGDLPGPAAQSAQTEEMERQVQQRINDIRREHGLSPLDPQPDLAAIAREFSRSMSQKNFFSHTGPSGDQVNDRLREAGLSFRLVGENIYKSTNVPNPVETAVEGWMQSPGHRANILREGFTQTGVGVWRNGATFYITQVFRRPL